MSTDLATETLDRWNQMKSKRQRWDTVWDLAARYCMPRKGDILSQSTFRVEPDTNIYDSTAEEACDLGAAGMMTHLMPAGEKWFRFQPKDKNASDDLRAWFDQVTDITTDAIYSSNFYLTAHEDCIDGLAFGTSAYLLDKGDNDEEPLNFTSVPVGTFCIEENCYGRVDTVGREWKWTVRQAVQRWGEDKLGEQQKKAFRSDKAAERNREFTYLHFVEPRKDSGYKGGHVSGTKRPIRSLYICIEDKQVIEEEGYYTMPYFCSRLSRTNNQPYGSGPGIKCLPETRLVNGMERDILIWIELMGNPPWLMPEDGGFTPDNRPGGITYWDSTNQNNKPEQIQMKNRPDLAEMKTEQKRERIRRAFYNDLFQMLTNMDEQKREKTAYEVQQMVAEKLLLFSPLFARYVVEKLNPMLSRVFDMLFRNGSYPPLPVGLQQGSGYDITYISKIALAIKAAETQSFVTMLQLIASAAAIDPSVVNVVNVRDGIRDVARNLGVSSKLIRSNRDVDRLTAQQQKALQEAQAAQTMEMATRSAKNLGPDAQKAATEAAAAAA
jgi:hypothetical protein